MGICVKVAQRPLTPSVEVRILNPQPKGSLVPPTSEGHGEVFAQQKLMI